MSLHLEFEPHSWYKGFAIKKTDLIAPPEYPQRIWEAYTDNGNTYRVDTLEANTLRELKEEITKYRKAEAARLVFLYQEVK